MNYMPKIDRRSFLVSSAAAGGLAVGLRLPFGDEAAAQTALPPEVNAWVVVQPDDTVIIRIARVDMGQGTLTGLAQLVAEELECDWSKVTWEYPSPGPQRRPQPHLAKLPDRRQPRHSPVAEYVREGGAAARMMLIQAAANEWKVPAGECVAANSVITHKPSGRTTTFGKVADAAGKLDVAEDPPLKDAKDWKIAGKPLKRLDTPDKINGKQIYAIDTKLPGMLNAAIKLSPRDRRQSEELRRSQGREHEGRQEGRPGRRLRRGGRRRHVVARQDRARCAADRLGRRRQRQRLERNDRGRSRKASTPIRLSSATSRAMPKAALASAAKKVEAIYAYPYQNHAPMEPMNTTALWTADGCQVWAPTQNAETALAVAAAAAGLPVGKCDVNRMHLGGGFGRRASSHDFVEQAVLIAKQMPGTPVKLIWSREEDMTHGRYHPITQCKLTGGFDAQGNLTALHMRISGQSIVASLLPQLLKDGMDPFVFQGLNPSGARRRVRLRDPEPAHRPCDAQHAHHAGVLARGEQQSERHLSRMLHG